MASTVRLNSCRYRIQWDCRRMTPCSSNHANKDVECHRSSDAILMECLGQHASLRGFLLRRNYTGVLTQQKELQFLTPLEIVFG